MAKIFLTAEWRNLLMANYEVDPAILKRHLPCYTELDSYNGKCYVSLVGFLFKKTRIRGMSFPFHKTFEEVNLRFYVRYKENNTWKRGVVFIKEIVPRRMITFIANTLYKENYATHVMRHEWKYSEDKLSVEYYWKVEKEWNHIKALADARPTPLIKDSEEEFITEHFWGYTFMSDTCSGEYEVAHPGWRIHKVNEYDIKCSAGKIYGEEFAEVLNKKPSSVFLAEGSPIKVMKGTKILNRI